MPAHRACGLQRTETFSGGWNSAGSCGAAVCLHRVTPRSGLGRKDPKAPPNPPVPWAGRLPPGQGAQGRVQPCLQHPHGSGHPQGSAGPVPAPQSPPGRASPPGLSPPSCTLSPLPLALIAAPPSCLTPGRCELPAAPPPLRQHPPDSPGTDRQPRTDTDTARRCPHSPRPLRLPPPPPLPGWRRKPRPGPAPGPEAEAGGERRGLNAQHRDRDRDTGQHRAQPGPHSTGGVPGQSPPPPRFPPEPARSLSARHTAPGGAGQPLLASSEPASAQVHPPGTARSRCLLKFWSPSQNPELLTEGHSRAEHRLP